MTANARPASAPCEHGAVAHDRGGDQAAGIGGIDAICGLVLAAGSGRAVRRTQGARALGRRARRGSRTRSRCCGWRMRRRRGPGRAPPRPRSQRSSRRRSGRRRGRLGGRARRRRCARPRAAAAIDGMDAVVDRARRHAGDAAAAVQRSSSARRSCAAEALVAGGVPRRAGASGAHRPAHFAALAAALAGDRGARPYLAAHGVVEVECADLWSGADIDSR